MMMILTGDRFYPNAENLLSILILQFVLFMHAFHLLYFVSNDNNKDVQSINQHLYFLPYGWRSLKTSLVEDKTLFILHCRRRVNHYQNRCTKADILHTSLLQKLTRGTEKAGISSFLLSKGSVYTDIVPLRLRIILSAVFSDMWGLSLHLTHRKPLISILTP